jgi:hypothetical protein
MNNKVEMNLYYIWAAYVDVSYVTGLSYYVVAPNLTEAKKLFKAKHRSMHIKVISEICANVIVPDQYKNEVL